jgi:hypothetical protein
MDCRTALATVLDSVDYTAGNCRPNEMVGAVLPKEMIVMARQAIADFDRSIAKGLEIANEVYGADFVVCVGCGQNIDSSVVECPFCGAHQPQK